MSQNTEKEVKLIYNFVDNEYVKPFSGNYIDNYNPATNEIISKIARSSTEDADNAIKAAKLAFPVWSSLTNRQRSDYLNKIADEIESRLDEFALLESEDNGKPYSLAKSLDIPRSIENFRFFARLILCDETKCHQLNDAINYTQRHPLGIVTLITPWNLPLYLLSWKIAPAIAVGNVVICKPSELTPHTANALTEIVKKINLPKGVINMVYGYGKEIGEPLLTHPDIAAVSFTGGTVTGSRVSALAGPLNKKLSLELGGKNPVIIYSDCNFNNMIETVVKSSFLNQGEICLCCSRIFVESSIKEKFLKEFINKTKETFSSNIGNPLTSNYGALISKDHLGKIEYYIDLAQKEGGNILLGGNKPNHLNPPYNNGNFYYPTIIDNLSYQSKCSTEEIFGPVVTIHEFNNNDELIHMCNYVKYGLCASIWSNNINTINSVAHKLDVGMVWINCWLYRDLRVPFGGVKQSGIGREGGYFSLDFYSHQKNICVKFG